MYLSKLELIGFKSFANKTSLKLTDGIACVIGPNGSGKSNIVDAIRWVLGEQKVSTLRSDKMENVIFNGTSFRKPLNYAEVSLTIENNKDILATSFSEVVISRRLYRSGESNYFINKAPCRLKDIIDLFMDTGMGSDSYSVIELKMIEDIISENPSERRHLFEEAAGITKYKVRRKSTIRKLEATRSDMERISDLMAEIKRTVNSLSRQVGKARRYLRYKDDLKKIDIQLSRFRFTRHMDNIRPLQQKLDEVKLIKEDTSHQITLEETLLEEYKRELLDIEKKLNEQGENQRTFERKIHEIKEEEAVAQTLLDSLIKTRERYKLEIGDLHKKQEQLSGHLAAIEGEEEAKRTALETIEKEYHLKEKKYQEFFNTLREEKKEIDTHNQQFRENIAQLSAKKEQYQQKLYHQEWNSKQIDKINNEIKVKQAEHDRMLHEIKEKELQKEQIDEEIKSIDKEITKNTITLNKTEDIIKQSGERINTIRNNINIVSSRINFFDTVISQYEGYPKSTQFLMKSRNDFPGLQAPLSELIYVDETYRIPVESALGEAIHYIVVETIPNAKQILDQVYKHKIGRVSLLPLESINHITVPAIDNKPLAPCLTEFISCEEKYRKIFTILLGDTFLAEDFNEALNTSESHPGIRWVTKQGEIINTSHAITGGSRYDKDTMLIGRKEHQKQLRNEYQNLQKDEEKLVAHLHQIEMERTKLEGLIGELSEKRIALKNKSVETDRDIDKCQYQNQITNSEILKAEQELKDISNLLSNLGNDIASLSKEIEDQEGNLKDVERLNISRSTAYERKEDELQVLNSEAQETRVGYLNAQNDFDNLKAEIVRTRTMNDETKNQITNRNIEIESITGQEKEIKVKSEERAKSQQLIWDQRDKLDDEIEHIQQSYHQIKDKIHQLEDQVKRFRKQHDSSLEHTKHLELQIQENKMKANTIIERIKNEYGEDITTGIAFEGTNEEENERQIETIKNKIAQLGQVNPLAVTEYEKESERLEFYTKQYNDLLESEKSLQKTITKINTTARQRFLETIVKIEENFKQVFQQFFENGEGSLKLEENGDPLEANIDIMVRPKGKRMQTISLLSGGEKALTAISLLFSIYLVKPSPFCILDEVDAPLDDVNISRFTQALKEFSENTQFIVVTHNKRTMESADTLFGVTMEEEGLSKLVSVKFN